MKKRYIITISLFLAFFIGLLVLLYPTIAEQWNRKVQSHAIADYENIINDMTKENYDQLFQQADAYNQSIAQIPYPFMNFDRVEGYESLLNVANNGIIGHISIPNISVELPIYHGCSPAVLQIAVGHLQGSSLPVGGEGTHSVLSAHRGLPSARLFTDLDKLQEGDIFTVTVLDRLLTYQVDKISIVDPDQVDSLYPVEGKDYMTLVTCTPYGINSHRLLVRGVRIENLKGQSVTHIAPQAYLIEPLVVAPIAATPMLIILALIVILEPVKKDKGEELL